MGYLVHTWGKREVVLVKFQTFPISYGVTGHVCNFTGHVCNFTGHDMHRPAAKLTCAICNFCVTIGYIYYLNGSH